MENTLQSGDTSTSLNNNSEAIKELFFSNRVFEKDEIEKTLKNLPKGSLTLYNSILEQLIRELDSILTFGDQHVKVERSGHLVRRDLTNYVDKKKFLASVIHTCI